MSLTASAGGQAPRGLPAFLVGPILYIVFVVFLVQLVTFVLDKAGVPAPLLVWGEFLAALLATVLPAYFVRAPGLAAFGNLDGSLPGVAVIPVQLVAMAPAALLAALMAGAPVAAACGALAMATALLLTMVHARLIGTMAGLSGPIRRIEERSGSLAVGALAALLAILPLLALFSAQLAGFARVAGNSLGLAPAPAIAVCVAIALMQAWLPGARGLVLGSIAWLTMAAAAIVGLWLEPESSLALSPLPAGELAGLILPFLPAGSDSWQWTDAPRAILHGLVLGAGIALLPLLRTPAVASTRPLRHLLRTLAIGAALAVATILSLPAGYRGSAPVTGLVLLFACSGLAAISLQAMAMLLASRGDMGGRKDLPVRRLAVARTAMLVFAAAGALLALHWQDLIVSAARGTLAVATAALLPLAIATLRVNIPQRSAFLAIAAGVLASVTALATLGDALPATGLGTLAAMLALAGDLLLRRMARLPHP